MEDQGILVRPIRWIGPVVFWCIGIFLTCFSLFAIVTCISKNEPIELAYFWGGVALFGLCLGLIGCYFWRVERNRRLWIENLPDGFVFRDHKGETYVGDDQVLSIGVAQKPNHNLFNGIVSSTTRTLHLWISQTEENHKKVSLIYHVPVGEADPLGELIVRINQGLVIQAKRDLESGQVVLGECWALDKKILKVTRPRQKPVEVPLENLEAIDLVDGEICFWIKGHDEPVAKIPLQGDNAFVLQELISEGKLKTDKENPEPKDGNLGRLIFERKSKSSESWVVVLIGCAFIGFPMIIVSQNGFTNENTVPAVIFNIAGVVLLGFGFFTFGGFFRRHKYGIHKKGVFSNTKIFYSEMEVVSRSAIRLIHNGVYAGTQYSFTFESVSGGKPKKIFYFFQIREEDNEMDVMFDEVSAMIAAKIVGKVLAGERVPWTTSISFLPEGLEYKAGSFLGKKETRLLPYDEILGHNFEDGNFSLFDIESSKPVLKESTSVRNFFPGFLALNKLMTD